ncbi:MAG: riboflavin synthase [Actinobacteria bacterium]|nr:riboflavin synthase [Actinomycetota bacterium]
MFTGIIGETGIIRKITNMEQDIEFEISSSVLLKGTGIGDSISVNGVCLTVKSFNDRGFTFDVSSNTLSHTNLSDLKSGDRVNLEDSLTPGDKLGGHFVSGHIDCTAKIVDIRKTGRAYEMTFDLPIEVAPFIAERGSVAIDGISLTVTEVARDNFKVVIIPHTFENTILGSKGAGSFVNIEVDMLARYIANYLKNINNKQDTSGDKDRILKEKLEKYGFI